MPSACIPVCDPVSPAWLGFRTFIASDFTPEYFWVKHGQLVLGLCLAASFVLLNDGSVLSQWLRLGVNLAVVGCYLAVLVRVGTHVRLLGQ